jgi:tetratricopeptide (TPR) repeat protein
MRRIFVSGALLAAIISPALTFAQDDGAWKAALVEAMGATGAKDYGRAEQAFAKALWLAETFGPADVRVGSTLNNLGLVYAAEHKYAEAESAYHRAIPVLGAAYGDSIDVANVSYNLASIQMEQGRAANALDNIDHALRIYERLLADNSPKVANTLCMKGDAYRLMKHYADAEGPLRRCADIREKINGIGSPELADALLGLARVLAAEGRASAAEARYKLVEKIREQTAGITSPLLAESMEEHATVLKELGRDKESEKLIAMSSAIRRAQGSAAKAK